MTGASDSTCCAFTSCNRSLVQSLARTHSPRDARSRTRPVRHDLPVEAILARVPQANCRGACRRCSRRSPRGRSCSWRAGSWWRVTTGTEASGGGSAVHGLKDDKPGVAQPPDVEATRQVLLRAERGEATVLPELRRHTARLRQP